MALLFYGLHSYLLRNITKLEYDIPPKAELPYKADNMVALGDDALVNFPIYIGDGLFL
jgi:hypothetical protein